jgi:flavin reductase (DIM6/NTAB) family NADH-FMN oxidoreductase RutF
MDRVPNIAPKSWVQMVSFEPPILMFSGSKGNTTENNILKTGCFAVNFVDSSMAKAVYGCLKWHGEERIEKCDFTLVPASKIESPLVDECKAHLECRLVDTKRVGTGFVIFGEIVAASIWDEILKAEPDKRYELLDQILFFEDGVYGNLGKSIEV